MLLSVCTLLKKKLAFFFIRKLYTLNSSYECHDFLIKTHTVKTNKDDVSFLYRIVLCAAGSIPMINVFPV